MTGQIKNEKTFRTCLEGIPFAEMMKKMPDQQGIGSLCEEMMKNFMEKQTDCSTSHCFEMIQTMMKNCCGMNGEPKE